MFDESYHPQPDDIERAGYVLSNGEIVELTNIHEDPKKGFEASADEIVLYCDDAVATWHTHPGVSANLSPEDWHSFVSQPDLLHYIIGDCGVIRTYKVVGKAVVNA